MDQTTAQILLRVFTYGLTIGSSLLQKDKVLGSFRGTVHSDG